MEISLKILNSNEIIFEGYTDYISVKSTDGRRGILKNHLPIILQLIEGELSINKNNKQYFKIKEGILSFNKNNCTVIIK